MKLQFSTFFISRILLLCSICVCMCCCSSSDEPVDDKPSHDTKTSIGLYLTLPTLSSGELTSRTPTDGPYDEGSNYENYIDITGQDYRIYVFVPGTNGNDKLYCKIDNDSISVLSSIISPTHRSYGLSFSISKDFYDRFNGDIQGLKLLILANWRNYPGETQDSGQNLSSIADGTDYSDATTLNDLLAYGENDAGFMKYGPFTPELTEDTRIPLFGIAQFKSVRLQNGMLTWLGDINILRAVAKIDVYDNPSTWAKIKNVSLTRYNTALAKAPANIYSQEDYMHGSYNPDYTQAPTVPLHLNGDNCENSTEFMLTSTIYEDKTKHFIVYVPEYKNLAEILDSSVDTPVGTPRKEAELARLKIEFEYFEKPYYVDFKYYNDSDNGAKKGQHFNILRNHWYQFEINKSFEATDIELRVIPYAEIRLDPSFGLDIK